MISIFFLYIFFFFFKIHTMEGGFGRWEELRGKYLSFYFLFLFFISRVFFGENTYTYVVSIESIFYILLFVLQDIKDLYPKPHLPNPPHHQEHTHHPHNLQIIYPLNPI